MRVDASRGKPVDSRGRHDCQHAHGKVTVHSSALKKISVKLMSKSEQEVEVLDGKKRAWKNKNRFTNAFWLRLQVPKSQFFGIFIKNSSTTIITVLLFEWCKTWLLEDQKLVKKRCHNIFEQGIKHYLEVPNFELKMKIQTHNYNKIAQQSKFKELEGRICFLEKLERWLPSDQALFTIYKYWNNFAIIMICNFYG